jgi:RNA polymerase sigma-70 factor (ECF subfamily)
MNINQIIEAHKNTVYGIALSHTRNVPDAEDIFQDVFLICHRKNPKFNDEEHCKAWLIRTTLNRCRKHAATSRRFCVGDDTRTPPPQEERFFNSELQNDIFNAMSNLPKKYRNALHLFYFEDLSTAQTAKLLKVKESTLRVQLKRARELMRDILKEDYFYEQ